MPSLKFWDRSKPDQLVFAKDLILETTEVDVELFACKVKDDHKIEFKGRNGKKTARVNPHIPAKQLILPFKQLWPKAKGNRDRIFFYLAKKRLPKVLLFRCYTIQAEGEMTHDPHKDFLDPMMKMQLENMLQLEAQFAEVEAGKDLYKGMEQKKGWKDHIVELGLMCLVALAILMPYM